MVDKIEQQWLRSFHRVFEFSSFKKAAEYLNLPSSNISRHVALLEEGLNVRLLERTTRRITPTEAGEQLYSSTITLLTALNDALEDVSASSEQVSGQLKLIMPEISLLSDAVVSFCVKHPGISILCDTSLSPKEDLLDGFDVILSFNRGNLADSGWVAKEILRWPSVVVATPQLILEHGAPVRLSELKQLPCITSFTALNGTPWVFKDAKLQSIKHVINSVFKVNSGMMAKTAALSSLGFAILPKESCLVEIASGSLQVITLETEPEDLVLYAFHTTRKHLPHKVIAFIEHLQNELNN